MAMVGEHIVEDNTNSHNYTDEEYEHAIKVSLPVTIAKVDCVTHQTFCHEQRIMAYPTLRLFVDGQRWKGGDYRGHRTVVDMADYLQQVEDSHKTELQSEKPKMVELVHEGTFDNGYIFASDNRYDIYSLIFHFSCDFNSRQSTLG